MRKTTSYGSHNAEMSSDDNNSNDYLVVDGTQVAAQISNPANEDEVGYTTSIAQKIKSHTQEQGADNTPTTLKLLTFNTWGLKYVSKFRKERLRAIADKLAGLDTGVPLKEEQTFTGSSFDSQNETLDYDVVALQEIWCQEDWDYLVMRTKQIYPFQRWFSSGILTGPGLAILSKIPIEETFLYRFPVNGRPSAFWRGDWYVGKSLSVTILQSTSKDSKICLMNSHMHAPYAAQGDAAYYCHRSCQSWDISKMIKLYREAGYYVILVGDLNSKPGTLPYRFMTTEGGLTDSWELYHTRADGSSTSHSLQEIETMKTIDQIKYGGCTCDSTLNTWRASRLPTEACRLDYALVDGLKFQALSCGVAFTERIPSIGSYSDHFAYTVTLQLVSPDQPLQMGPMTPKFKDEELTHMLSLNRLKNYDDMLYVLNDYFETAYWQKRWRITHFFASVVFLVIMVIITTFTSNRAGWSSVLILLASCVVAITGLTNGFIGFLFGQKEIRALKEVEQEVRDSKQGLQLRMHMDKVLS
ncbi:Inositol phosphosphingolipids phospholipase C [Hanseniaspora osmophila]|uniref:Inositol phosphosphingolipids phospholipase C n=1 Tax=Hanseniaspora osmophila TaxID=56408 RepID=A0A1E5RGM2_9ASCO|nr:Inositol phosphosphingolipids phospholipase C [Hanseniaspora osmophila]